MANMAATGKKPAKPEIASTVRYIYEGMVRKIGVQACIDMLIEEAEKDGLSVVLSRAKAFIPQSLLVDMNHHVTLDTTSLTPEQLREVFSGKGIEHATAPVHGGDTLEASGRSTVERLPQPS